MRLASLRRIGARHGFGLAALVLLLALACSGPDYTDGSAEVEGDWWVDFGADEGALRLADGEILALCYGPAVQLGSYRVRSGRLAMTMDFRDGAGEHRFGGAVVRDSDDGFRLDLAEVAPGAKLTFSRYEGDCSETPGR